MRIIMCLDIIRVMVPELSCVISQWKIYLETTFIKCIQRDCS